MQTGEFATKGLRNQNITWLRYILVTQYLSYDISWVRDLLISYLLMNKPCGEAASSKIAIRGYSFDEWKA